MLFHLGACGTPGDTDAAMDGSPGIDAAERDGAIDAALVDGGTDRAGSDAAMDAPVVDGGTDAASRDAAMDAGADDDAAASTAADAGPADAGGEADAGPPELCRWVFLSSERVNGSFGGATGADAVCQRLADGAGPGGSWRAWISDSGSSPATTFTRSSVPYRRLDLALVANDWADLTDGTLAAPISIHEDGTAVSIVLGTEDAVWTATAANGLLSSSRKCSDWTSASSSVDGAVGRATAVDSRWTDQGAASYCNARRRLYCFEQSGPHPCDVTRGERWLPTSTVGAPSPRTGHTATWTGSRMLVWGGDALGTGASYDPVWDTWSSISTTGAPSARTRHTSVWAGTELIVWGGVDWLSGDPTASGARYDPLTDTWTDLTSVGAPSDREGHSAVWADTGMIVWGGFGAGGAATDSGASYDPVADAWTPLTTVDAPSARGDHTGSWTGGTLIVWGGTDRSSGPFATGGQYSPLRDRWIALPTADAPSPRAGHTVPFMTVWGGVETHGTPPVVARSGAYFDGWTWTPLPLSGAPAGALGHTAVWVSRGTRSEMIVWGGGRDTGVPIGSGGAYDPASASWTDVLVTGAPSPRYGHTAVWTGTEMIVWGGEGAGGLHLDTGGRYRPR